MKSGSNLEKLLEKGEFVVTGELGPPKGTDVDAVKQKAAMLKDNVDAVNITDIIASLFRSLATICMVGSSPSSTSILEVAIDDILTMAV